MLDELERLRAVNAPDPAPAALAAARTQLMDAITSEPRKWPRPWLYAITYVRDHIQVRRTRILPAGGLAAAILAVAAVFGLRTPANPPSALAAEMNQLAQIAASQAWTGTPGPGQYLYTEAIGTSRTTIVGKNPHGCNITQRGHSQTWIATNGAGASREILTHGRFDSTTDRAICRSMGITLASQEGESRQSYGPHGLSPIVRNWHALSTDPATLLKEIHKLDGGPNSPAELFVNVGDMLRESGAPPVIRAALYRAVALIPGVRLDGLVRDPPAGAVWASACRRRSPVTPASGMPS